MRRSYTNHMCSLLITHIGRMNNILSAIHTVLIECCFSGFKYTGRRVFSNREHTCMQNELQVSLHGFCKRDSYGHIVIYICCYALNKQNYDSTECTCICGETLGVNMSFYLK